MQQKHLVLQHAKYHCKPLKSFPALWHLLVKSTRCLHKHLLFLSLRRHKLIFHFAGVVTKAYKGLAQTQKHGLGPRNEGPCNRGPELHSLNPHPHSSHKSTESSGQRGPATASGRKTVNIGAILGYSLYHTSLNPTRNPVDLSSKSVQSPGPSSLLPTSCLVCCNSLLICLLASLLTLQSMPSPSAGLLFGFPAPSGSAQDPPLTCTTYVSPPSVLSALFFCTCSPTDTAGYSHLGALLLEHSF